MTPELGGGWNIWVNNGYGGLGTQVQLFVPSTINKVKFKLRKYAWDNSPTGTLVARIYNSATGVFRDWNDFADTLIAESFDFVDIEEDLENGFYEYEFNFDDVELEPGIYFFVLYTEDADFSGGVVELAVNENVNSAIGTVTFYIQSEARWGSMWEWD